MPGFSFEKEGADDKRIDEFFFKGQFQGSGECGKGHLTGRSLAFRFFHTLDE